jgi:hypothetical protein
MLNKQTLLVFPWTGHFELILHGSRADGSEVFLDEFNPIHGDINILYALNFTVVCILLRVNNY